MITTVFFDLDGTLLPMNQDEFIRSYFRELTTYFAMQGIEPKRFQNAVWAGTEAMLKNNGSMKNEACFFQTFTSLIPERPEWFQSQFKEFYETKFDRVNPITEVNSAVIKTIKMLADAKIQLVVATNPLFPMIAVKKRLQWAGLNPDDFMYITSFENSSSCKPNCSYYQEILEVLHLSPKECVMIGNDVGEDMIAETLGFSTYLVTDCLINQTNQTINQYKHGTFASLLDSIQKSNHFKNW